MEKIIEDADLKHIKRNILSKMIKNTRSVLSRVSETLRLRIHNPQIPSLNALPKVHKPGNNMRPTVSNINSP